MIWFGQASSEILIIFIMDHYYQWIENILNVFMVGNIINLCYSLSVIKEYIDGRKYYWWSKLSHYCLRELINRVLLCYCNWNNYIFNVFSVPDTRCISYGYMLMVIYIIQWCVFVTLLLYINNYWIAVTYHLLSINEEYILQSYCTINIICNQFINNKIYW